MIARAPCALLQHQQPQRLALAEYALLHRRHLLWLDVVDVHPHRVRRPDAPFQASVLIGQARVVHLHQPLLQRRVALAHRRHRLHLVSAIPQR
ncbi:MAG: hypothetical protein IJK15_05490 [Bacteroidaceae bacterium]|nr:hypothetical protein [Bacteroidaceae bacterium]